MSIRTQMLNCKTLDTMDMNSDHRDTRVINLRDKVKQEGSIAAFARRYGVDATYVSQLLNGHRNFGEKAARSFEEKMGIGTYALDFPYVRKKVWPFPRVPESRIEMLNQSQLEQVEMAILAVLSVIDPGEVSDKSTAA